MKKLVLVDTISQHRIRYVFEVENDISHALDEIACNNNLEEFSQEHLGETIVSHREITNEEYIKIFNEDNDYLASWLPEQKIRFINKLNYGDENDNTNPSDKT